MKTALVTGASYGLGEALTKELLSMGWQVVGVARSKEKLASMQQACFIPIVCDVADEERVVEVSKELQMQGINPTLFFLNAATTGQDAIEDHLDLKKHKEMFAVNYFGVLSWIAFWQKEAGKTFVVTSSVNVHFCPPEVIAYSASKAAISKAFEGLAVTNQDNHFMVVYAGPIETAGLKTPKKLPLTQDPAKLAKKMIQAALQKKERLEPSLVYSLVTRALHALPSRWSANLLEKLRE